jgi:hypothetical protein
MNKRPLAITIISWLFICVGCVGIFRGPMPLIEAVASERGAGAWRHELADAALVCGVGLVALVGGVYTMRGARWGLWLLVAWMGFHIVLSFLHSISQVLFHSVLFGIIAYFLFRSSSAGYFRAAEHSAER